MLGASSSSAAFWASFLASAHPLLELPVDKTRPSSRSTELDYVPWSLPASCGPQLAAAAARAGTTPVLLVLAAWQALLARMSRQDNVTLGVVPSSLLQQHSSSAPSAEHGGDDDAKTPLHVALLPLSTPVDLEADCLSTLVARNARLLGQVAPHAHMALQDICAAAQTVPSAAYHPLFQAAFLMAPAGCRAADGRALAAAALSAGPPSRSALSARLIASAFNDDGCDEDSSAAGVPAAPLDLLLLLQGDSLPAGGGHAARARVAGPVAGLLAFSCDVFERQMVELLARHLEVLLTSALSTPTAALAGLAMMSPQEHQQVLHGFNATAVPLTDASLVHQCFARCAVNQPGAACLVYEGETMSYGEVDAVSNRLANTLIQRCGVREGDVVGLLMHRSANMVAGLLGVLKSGAAYLPLDAGHPPDRTAYILADAGVKVVVVQPELAHLLPPPSTPDIGSGGGVLYVVLPSTGLGGELLAASTASPGQLGRPDDLAYVIYTSGSTGNPKGVMVTHANLAHFLAWERAEFGYSEGDVFLHKTPTNFDVSVEELWTPLSCGACLVVAKPGGHKDTGYLATLMERHAVRTLSMVPSQIAMLLLEADTARLPALKRIVAAGEALTSSLARQVHEVLPHVELVNGYGPTEATVYITHHVVRCGEVGARPTASIGRPLANATAYVVDAANRLAPIGVPGELAVSGPQITRGYLNLPDKTAAVFVPNPYRLGPGSCTDVMYRTGDLARWLPDGRLECLGRTDHQVKLRGYRIELQEIESALSAHDGIQAAVCAIVKDGAGQARLAAYVERPLTSAAASGLLDRAAVRRSLARRLPAYMLPDVLVVLPQLPRLSNEKINRKALPTPDWAADAFGCSGPAAPSVASATGGGGGQSYTAKQLAADAVLAAAVAAWAGALGVDPAGLGPGSDFAGLGGNSLQAGLMAAALRKALQLPHLSGLLVYSHGQLGAFVSEVKVAAAVSCKAAAPEGMLAGVAPQLLASGSTAASTVASSSVVAPGSASRSGGRCGPSALPLWVATVLQLLAAAVVMGMQILINLAPLVTVQFLMASGSEWEALAAIPMAKAVAILSSVVLHVGAKWLLVGRYKEGLTPIYGLHYVAAWVEKLLFRSVQAQLLPFIRGTALMNAYLNALGARVHASAFVDAEDVFEPDLIEVQAGAFVGGNCVLAGATRRAATSKQGEPGGAYRYGSVAYNKVSIGARAVVGPLCVLAGAGASLPDAAVLPPNSSSTDPAALKRGQAMRPEVLRCADRPLGAGPAAAALAVVVLFESALLVPATVVFVLMWDVLVVSTGDPSPAVMLACWQTPATQRSTQMNGVCGEAMHGELLSLALFPIVYLLSTLLLVPPVLVLAKWLLMGRVTAAKLRSTHPLRVWTTHVWVLLQRCWSVRMVTHMLQGTGAYNTLLRALGFKVGRQAWISNANISLVTPDMVSIGATASMGSDVHFYNATDAHEGAIVIGDAADVGHQATLYPGAMLQPGAVLGAKSNVLASETLQAGAIRLGNMLLHHGTAAKDVESSTSCSSVSSAAAELVRARIIPTWRYVCCNIAVLAGSALLVPVTYMLLSLPMLAVLMVALWEGSGLLVAPAVLLGFLLNITAILAWMALLRRLLVHSSPGVRPFWSSFFVRWMIWDGPLNVVNTAFTPFFGSAIIIWLYRAIGCQVGGGCCLFGGYPGEPDALVIGDGAVLEPYAGASTHTIERRQLTISTVRVHERATAGVYSLLLPGAELEAGARLESCSVLLKGERAAAGSTWRGIPAEPVW